MTDCTQQSVDTSNCVDSPNSLIIANFTGQPIYVTMILAKKDSDCNPMYDSNGYLLIDKKSSSKKCGLTTTTSGAESDPTVISGWYPTYDGFTAQTEDGKYSITVGRNYSSSPNHHLAINDGNCMNAWATLCIKRDDGTFSCVNSQSSEFSGMESGFANGSQYTGNTFTMSSTERYYGSSGISWIRILVILLLVVAVIAAIVFGYRKYKSRNP